MPIAMNPMKGSHLIRKFVFLSYFSFQSILNEPYMVHWKMYLQDNNKLCLWHIQEEICKKNYVLKKIDLLFIEHYKFVSGI